jgi:hypothetical protein
VGFEERGLREIQASAGIDAADQRGLGGARGKGYPWCAAVLGHGCAADERADGVVVAEGGGEGFEEDGGETFAAGVAAVFVLEC